MSTTPIPPTPIKTLMIDPRKYTKSYLRATRFDPKQKVAVYE